MKIQVLYSDYESIIENAKIDIDADKYVSFELFTYDDPSTTDTVETIKKLRIKSVDSIVSNEIPLEMTKEELSDYIILLQKLARQL